MPPINGYATLSDWKNTKDIESLDNVDDSVIEQLIESASRFIDEKTAKTFYPRVQTRYHSVPSGETDPEELWLDDDLLEIITLTNGNGVVISSSDYYTKPRNDYPKYAIALKSSSSISWATDANGNSEYVIPVNAFWGFHAEYNLRGWKIVSLIDHEGGITPTRNPIGTLAADIAKFNDGDIIKIDNEIMIIASHGSVVDPDINTGITVVQRGDNGSTPADHTDQIPIYVWQPMPTIRMACMEIVKSAYSRRFGTNTTGTAIITGAGVVITPEEVPAFAWNIINTYKPDVP